MEINLKPLPERDVLAGWWRQLESRAQATFFTTWSWMSAWLDMLPPDRQPQLLTATRNGVVVGLGLVVRGQSRLLRFIPVPCWRLHTTGVFELDDLVIEYNGFLVDPACARETRDAMLNFLLYRTGVKRVEISNADNSYADLAQHQPNGLMVRAKGIASYVVDLDKVRHTEGGYVSLLSPNTRSQLRRSLSAYQKVGPLLVHAAQDVEQARTYFAALKALHEKTWQSRGEWSSFGSSQAAHDFHQRLITSAFDRGEVQLLRITAGDTDLGYLYNFVHDGRVAFYQSGLNFGVLDKHDRPGVVCHALAVEHNVQAGHVLYDFLAGEHRYKASLATHREPQATYVLQRRGMLARLDEALRGGQQRWRQWREERVLVSQLDLLIATVAAYADIFDGSGVFQWTS